MKDIVSIILTLISAAGFPSLERSVYDSSGSGFFVSLSILLTKNPAMRLGLNPLLCTYIVKRRSHEPLFTTFENILPETALYESYYNLTAENRRSSLLLTP